MPLPGGGLGEALRSSSSELAQQLRSINQNSMDRCAPPEAIGMGRGSSLGNLCIDKSPRYESSGIDYGGSVLQRLDEGLQSLRAEVAALDSLRFLNSGIADIDPRKEFTVIPPSRQSKGLVDISLSQLALPPPGGLAWIPLLPEYMQGRLAACTGLAEAVDVLDEAIDGFTVSRDAISSTACSKGDDNLVPRKCKDGHRVGRWRSAGACVGSRHQAVIAAEPAVREATKSRDLLIASTELLRATRSRASDLEAELEERQRLHEEQVAELKYRYREERHRKLQRLLRRLTPGSGTTSGGLQELDTVASGDSRAPAAPVASPPWRRSTTPVAHRPM